jgi:hypothetical protein
MLRTALGRNSERTERAHIARSRARVAHYPAPASLAVCARAARLVRAPARSRTRLEEEERREAEAAAAAGEPKPQRHLSPAQQRALEKRAGWRG